jgi:squalene-hopene/tetraprenyl-beta-curcumene cyclase
LDSRSGLAHLARVQHADGSWRPLWFGTQNAPGHENPVFGTARVLRAYGDLGLTDAPPAAQGYAYLLAAQHADGGWGGAPAVAATVEETAAAVDALADAPDPSARTAAGAGAAWLAAKIKMDKDSLDRPSPIGLYFARLWYYESLYPIVMATTALRRMLERQ